MTTATASATPHNTIRHVVNVRGEFLRLPYLRNQEACFEGPAGTAKTRTILEYIHAVMKHYAGAHALLARWRMVDLTDSAVQTYRNEVLQDWDGVSYFGGSRQEPPAFMYPNGSRIFLTGLDRPEKVKSKQYNLVYVNEATEIEENTLEMLRSRVGRDPRLPFWQLLMDANPTFPRHWLNQRMIRGQSERCVTSRFDNPGFYTDDAAITPLGELYMQVLDGLTGVRRSRLVDGRWVAAEGTVYEDAWSVERNLKARNVISRRPDDLHGDAGIDREWPRYVSIDWGYVNPAVVQWYAKDHDGRLWLYREIYVSNRTVVELADDVLRVMGWKRDAGVLTPVHPYPEPLKQIRAWICDHDAGDRATFEKATGFTTTPAKKGIEQNVQAVRTRLELARLFVLRDSLVSRDRLLVDKKLPTSTVEEFDVYEWDTRSNRAPKEIPLDANNHGMDALGYQVAFHDRTQKAAEWGAPIWTAPATGVYVSPLDRFVRVTQQ